MPLTLENKQKNSTKHLFNKNIKSVYVTSQIIIQLILLKD